MNKRVLTGILAIILFFSCFVRVSAVTSYHEEEVEEYVIRQLAAAHIPGVSLSIVTSQKEIYSAAFGDVEDTTSDLQIGALTRTFTTLAIMQLIEEGKISLDDRVYRYVDAKTRTGISANMSIKDLFSYTRNYAKQTLKFSDAFNLYNTDIDSEELSVHAKFNLLGKIIEKVSGTSYASYIKENIALPLDMQSTYVIGEAGYTKDIIPGNKNFFGLPLKNSISYDSEYLPGIASNGIVSDIKDMGKYMQMYLSAGGKVISYNAVESIMSGSEVAGKSIFDTDAYYSMGWTVTETDGKEIYYCNGSVDDYTSAMFIIPSMDIGITMLFNSADALMGQKFTDDIEAGVVSLVMGNDAKGVSSNDYLMKHASADIVYFIAFVCALMPILLMEVWIKWTRERFSILRICIDVALHIILPTALIFIVHYCIAPWGIIKIVMPDLFCVAAVVTGLFYFGALVKLIAYFIIRHRGDIENAEEEIDEEEENIKQIQEKKEKLRKRMDDIKEAEKDKPVTKALETPAEESEKKLEDKSEKTAEKKPSKKPERDNTKDRQVQTKQVQTKQGQAKQGQTKQVQTKQVQTKQGQTKQGQTKQVQTRQKQIRQENKPKRFVVVNESSKPKNYKENNTNTNKNHTTNRNINRKGNETTSRNNQRNVKKSYANNKTSNKNKT